LVDLDTTQWAYKSPSQVKLQCRKSDDNGTVESDDNGTVESDDNAQCQAQGDVLEGGVSMDGHMMDTMLSRSLVDKRFIHEPTRQQQRCMANEWRRIVWNAIHY
jgi:hypothetical protein